MKLTIGLCLAFGLLIAAAAPKKDANDQDRLQGTWTLIAGEADGKALPENELAGGRLVLKGDDYMVTLAGKGTVTGTQTLDTAKNPRQIDIRDASGSNSGKACFGIYELEGDEFRVAFASSGKPRPTNFATTADSGQWMHVWHRVQE